MSKRAVINTSKLLDDIASGRRQCDVFMWKGKIHRDNGPAIVDHGESCAEVWCKNGVVHRDGKMAAIIENDRPYFYLNGRQFVPDAKTIRTIYLTAYIIYINFIEGSVGGYLSAHVAAFDTSDVIGIKIRYSCYDKSIKTLLTLNISDPRVSATDDLFVLHVGSKVFQFVAE